MDQSRPTGGQPFPPNHALLLAGAAVAQASAPTAILAARMARHHRKASRDGALGALIALFSGEDAGAAARLRGSFHPRIAANRTARVKAGLTFAF